MRTLVVGNGGRESSLAWRLAQESAVFAVMRVRNPTITRLAQRTGGAYLVADFLDPNTVACFAEENAVDLAVVSNDAALEAGVVDALHQRKIPTVGPTRLGAEIEWNKAFARTLLKEAVPGACPRYWLATSIDEVARLFAQFRHEKLEVVIKPQGLTGGKGVLVMGQHLENLAAAERYAISVLEKGIGRSTTVVIEEKLDGVEFTIQALTDEKSIVRVPASYDYPFRLAGDTGPGTGGMGSFVDSKLPLPFMSQTDYDQCIDIITQVLDVLHSGGHHFNGVLNTGFFLTPNGLRVMEFNARFGDPECMNIMSIIEGPVVPMLQSIADQSLRPHDVQFVAKASVVKYLVSPGYCLDNPQPSEQRFQLNEEAINSEGGHVFFASAEAISEHEFRSVGSSRTVAILALGDSVAEASEKVEGCISKHVSGPLDHRRDIGTQPEMDLLRTKAYS